MSPDTISMIFAAACALCVLGHCLIVRELYRRSKP